MDATIASTGSEVTQEFESVLSFPETEAATTIASGENYI